MVSSLGTAEADAQDSTVEGDLQTFYLRPLEMKTISG